MKYRHNKKRNPSILYEVLVQELTKSIVEQEKDKQKYIVSLIKEFFGKKTVLRKEYEIFKQMQDLKDLEEVEIRRIFEELKARHVNLNTVVLNKEKSKLIARINKGPTPSAFGNFIPNYRSLASISQIFNRKISPKNMILLENKMIEQVLDENKKKQEELQPIDNLTYHFFVKRFNEEYSNSLLREQKELLGKYVMAVGDNLEFKIYLNEEIGRLKGILKESQDCEDLDEVIALLESYKDADINDDMIETVLKVQELVGEIKEEQTNG